MKKITIIVALLSISVISKAQFNCGDTLIDIRDGKRYTTILIGSQCWMAENLNYGNMIVGSVDQSNNQEVEKFYYNDITSYGDIYGGLYQWDEMMQYNASDIDTIGTIQGICPNGWHIPTHHEWTTLERAICTNGNCNNHFPYDITTFQWHGTDEGGKLKQSGTTHWNSPNNGATNVTGFNVLPAGRRNYSLGPFMELGSETKFWSATEINNNQAWARVLDTWSQDIARDNYDKSNGFSVRCAMDVNLIGNDEFSGNKEIQPNEVMFISNSYPNPVVSTSIIYFKLPNGISMGDFVVHDILGTEILRITVDNGINVISISTSDLSDGTYFYNLQTSQSISRAKKMIVIK